MGFPATSSSLERRAPKIVSHFWSNTAERGIDLAGALQSGLHMRQDILLSDVLDEIGFMKQLRWLVARST